jgi:hypothetical protein
MLNRFVGVNLRFVVARGDHSGDLGPISFCRSSERAGVRDHVRARFTYPQFDQVVDVSCALKVARNDESG